MFFLISKHFLNIEKLKSLWKLFGVEKPGFGANRHTHKNTRIKFKNGKTTIEFESTVGVKQGDNLALILFLFMIEAAMEIIEMEFKNGQKSIPKFIWNPVSDTLKEPASKDTLNQFF